MPGIPWMASSTSLLFSFSVLNLKVVWIILGVECFICWIKSHHVLITLCSLIFRIFNWAIHLNLSGILDVWEVPDSWSNCCFVSYILPMSWLRRLVAWSVSNCTLCPSFFDFFSCCDSCFSISLSFSRCMVRASFILLSIAKFIVLYILSIVAFCIRHLLNPSTKWFIHSLTT